MDDVLFERLLHEEESTTLDFKRDQYRFAGGSDYEKSELLKDIVAFANSWRRTDAFILIGVEEVRGGRSRVWGVVEHLSDHSLQQFVNHKTNRPIHFSYEAYSYGEKQVGIIRIEPRSRPFYLTSDYGKLRKDIVYIRRGSSTGEANLDEVAQMGTVAMLEEPQLSVQFAQSETAPAVGDSIRLATTFLDLPARDVFPSLDDLLQVSRSDLSFQAAGEVNADYFQQKAEYLFIMQMTRPLRLMIENVGTTVANEVRVEATVLKRADICMVVTDSLPYRPQRTKEGGRQTARMLHRNVGPGHAQVASYDDRFEIVVDCGDIQPGRRVLSEEVYVGCGETSRIVFRTRLFANNLTTPKDVQLVADLDVVRKRLLLEELLYEQDDGERDK